MLSSTSMKTKLNALEQLVFKGESHTHKKDKLKD